ncbi:hypothetical protein Ancab_031972 [Ancistrocladus abbreviatus]
MKTSPLATLIAGKKAIELMNALLLFKKIVTVKLEKSPFLNEGKNNVLKSGRKAGGVLIIVKGVPLRPMHLLDPHGRSQLSFASQCISPLATMSLLCQQVPARGSAKVECLGIQGQLFWVKNPPDISAFGLTIHADDWDTASGEFKFDDMVIVVVGNLELLHENSDGASHSADSAKRLLKRPVDVYQPVHRKRKKSEKSLLCLDCSNGEICNCF